MYKIVWYVRPAEITAFHENFRICPQNCSVILSCLTFCRNDHLIYIDILVLPATEVTAPAKKSALLLTWGENAPMRATLNLPKISAAASIEMQMAESVLE